MSHELLPIPPVESATDPVASSADLRQRWRALMGPLGFGERLLRFAFLGPDRCFIKVLSDVPIRVSPDRRLVSDLMSELKAVIDGMPAGTTVAFLLTRPGRGPTSINDRRWAASIREFAAQHGVPIEDVFRANDESLLLVEADLEATG